MDWVEFEVQAPELARLGRRLMEKDQLVMIGTVRRDGSPRVCPVEPDITNGRLYLGMMWQSLKALDLLRDPRCTVHCLVHDRMATDGEFKLFGRAVVVNDPHEEALYRQALFERIDWEPGESPFHLFAIDIEGASSFNTEDETRLGTIWRAGQSIRKIRQYADNSTIEVA